MLYEEQNIQWKHICAKIVQSLQRIIRSLLALGLLRFFSSLNVSLSAATKNLITNYTFFVKPKCVLLIGETQTQ